jgi:hypothetical protein
MYTKIEIALSAAIVLSTALSASAATKPRVTHVHRTAIYNMVPAYNASRDPSAPSGLEAPDRFGIESQR